MVYRNNDIIETEKRPSEVPAYPFNVDVPSFPERKYLVGIYRFARIVYVALFIAMGFCLLTILRAFSQDISPRFIKWNEIENRYEFVNFKYGKKPSTPSKEISYAEYLNQYFVRTYIEKRFSITNSIQNFNNWCDCNGKTASKMGIFNLNEEFYLCHYSSSSIYKSFVDNTQNAYTTMAQDGIKRTTNILDIKLQNFGETNPELSVIEWVLNKTKAITIYRTYRIDFIVNEFKNNKLTSKDVLIGYITIQGDKLTPQRRGVIAESYMFNPNYDLVLKNYAEEINAIK